MAASAEVICPARERTCPLSLSCGVGRGFGNPGTLSIPPREKESSHCGAHFKIGESKAQKGPGVGLRRWLAEGDSDHLLLDVDPHQSCCWVTPKTLALPGFALRAKSLVSEGCGLGSWLSNNCFCLLSTYYMAGAILSLDLLYFI